MPAKKPVDLVLEGGGVKGIGLAGAYAALAEEDYEPRGVAGTSAGAIAAALIAVGYSADELDEVLQNVPFADFKDRSLRDRVPIFGPALSLVTELGIYEGKFFLRWMTELLERKGITKFRQVVDDGADNPKHRYRLRVIASDVTHRRMLVLPNDAEHLGIDPDELEIAQAVRMSMSIPAFFEPVICRDPGGDHVIVDGGLLSNFPVWLFDSEGQEPRWPTFGLMLAEPDPKVAIGHRLVGDLVEPKRRSLVHFVKALAQTAMEAHDRVYLEQATYARTIAIPTLGVGTTEFDIDPARRRALYESGFDATKAFLASWDFETYIAEFRRGKEHSRRDTVTGRSPDS
jgi:NTE family protein